MRKFVVSDLHGDYNIYMSIISYLENISKEEEVELYINGDLIDRGIYSADLLIDVKKRIENNYPFKIIYLAGNHEQLMWDAYPVYKRTDKNRWFDLHNNTDWCNFGGSITESCMEDMLTEQEEDNMFHFIKKLKLYHKFEETLNSKPIVLAHAKVPTLAKKICDLTIEDVCSDINDVIDLIFYRKEHLILPETREKYDILWASKVNRVTRIPDDNINLGNDLYFSIVGHTPNNSKYGFEYDKNHNVLNIDSGLNLYWKGCFEYDHVPLVEIDSKNNRLIILTFNHNNEIIYGNYFDGNIVPMNNMELNRYKKNLNKRLILMPTPDKDLFE